MAKSLSKKPPKISGLLIGHPLANDKNRRGAVYSSHHYRGQPIEYCWSGDHRIFIISSREIEKVSDSAWKVKRQIVLGKIEFNAGLSHEVRQKAAQNLALQVMQLKGVKASNVTRVSAKTREKR